MIVDLTEDRGALAAPRSKPMKEPSMRRAAILIPFLTAALPTAGPLAAEPLDVYADSGPMAYFAARIAGDAATVAFPAPPGVDPEFWRPSIAALSSYQAADVIVLTGAGFAGWTERVSLPRGRIVDASRALTDRLIAVEGVTHSHGPEGEHTHEGVSPYVWMDFALAAEQAAAIAEGLARRAPSHAAVFADQLGALQADLSSLDAQAQALGGGFLLAQHPRWPYFARAYGFTILSVDWPADAAPEPDRLNEIRALLTEAPDARVMLWEGEPSPAMVAALAELGVIAVDFHHGAGLAEGESLIEMMESNLARLRAALGQGD